MNKLPEPDIKVPGISNLMGVLLYKRTTPRNISGPEIKRERAVGGGREFVSCVDLAYESFTAEN